MTRMTRLLVASVLGAAAVLFSGPRSATGQTPAIEPNSIKRFFFDCARAADVPAVFSKRGLTAMSAVPAPAPGAAATFLGRYANGLEIPYLIENIGGAFHVYAVLRRPQFPVPPLPYVEQEVVFDNPEAGLSLVGSLTLPRGPGPFPAAVLIAGSGAHTRDELVSLHKTLLVLADHLTRRGLAVLRYDKRGVGLSGGRADPDSTTDDYASDVRAAVHFLRIQPGIDPGRIGLVGHSEGGIVAPMVAAGNPEIAFVVLLAGTGLPGYEVRMLQENALNRAGGVAEKQVLANDRLNRIVFPLIIATKDNDEAVRKINVALRQALAPQERKLVGFPEAGWPTGALGGLLTPWFRRFLELDPRPYLEKVRCPVLALNGAKDLQVLADENLEAITQALRRGGNEQATIKKLPGLNHQFQTAPTGSPGEYRNIEETFAPSALKLVSDWILAGLK